MQLETTSWRTVLIFMLFAVVGGQSSGPGGDADKVGIPGKWERAGLVMARGQQGPGSEVVGDPCIVWDEKVEAWRMILFYAPPGHAQAICRNRRDLRAENWDMQGPLEFTNPENLLGGFTHKPYIVMDLHRPNHAAKVNGKYYLLTVSHSGGHKLVQRASASNLAGPWALEPEALIPTGTGADFDAKHTDAVTGYYSEKRKEFLYFYMGYPNQAQPRSISPFGSAQGVAVQKLGESAAKKLGPVLPPAQKRGHWASGWVGGLQLLPGKEHRWIAIVNASPTAPDPSDKAKSREEPPPSLGGFAYCDEEWPVSGWKWSEEPIEWIKDIPKPALDWGEGVNLWRQHILVTKDKLYLLYNSGPYGTEQLFMKVANR